MSLRCKGKNEGLHLKQLVLVVVALALQACRQWSRRNLHSNNQQVERANEAADMKERLAIEKLFCPRADKRPPPSPTDTLESPPCKGVVKERFRRGTTDDMLPADVWSRGASE